MKNLFLSIILTSACIFGYGQVKGPDKGVKVSSTPTVDRAARPGGPAGNERPVGKERPKNDPSSAAPEKSQKPQSQLEREIPSKSRGQSSQSQLGREMPPKEKPSSVKPSSENATNNAFCNGWRDGYIKEWNAKSEVVVTPNVPPCEENPNLEKIITVRHLDDAGKDPNLETSDFWYFAPLVQRMVEEKNATVE